MTRQNVGQYKTLHCALTGFENGTLCSKVFLRMLFKRERAQERERAIETGDVVQQALIWTWFGQVLCKLLSASSTRSLILIHQYYKNESKNKTILL